MQNLHKFWSQLLQKCVAGFSQLWHIIIQSLCADWFSSSWTEAMCSFNSCFNSNWSSHISHLNGFFPHELMQYANSNQAFHQTWLYKMTFKMIFFSLWTEATCSFNSCSNPNCTSHTSHLNGFSTSWIDVTFELNFLVTS